MPHSPSEHHPTRPDAVGHRAPRSGSLVRGLARWTLLTVGVTLAALVAAWWILLHQIVPKIGQWREPIAQQASALLGMPVQIGQLRGQARGWLPELTLDDVVLTDAAGQPALRLPQVVVRLSSATFSPRALWRQEIHVDELTLVRPSLDIRRDTQGRLHVAGRVIDLQQGPTGDHQPLLDWLLSQRLLRIEQGRIQWHDEWRQAPPLALEQVDLSMRQRSSLIRRSHEWTLSATPPATFGQRGRFEARITQPLWMREGVATSEPHWWSHWIGSPTAASDWRSWSGRASVMLPQVDVQALRHHAQLPFDLQGGRGALSLHLDVVQGQPRQVGLDVAISDVNLRLARDLPALRFRRIDGHIEALHEPTRTQLAWQKLTFQTDDGLTWPSSQARLQWRHPAARLPAGTTGPSALLPELQGEAWERTLDGQLEIDHLDLAILARLADRLPLAAGLREQLQALAPRGVARQLSLNWEGPALAPRTYSTRGQLVGAAWDAAGYPGLSGATLSFQATQNGGQASADIAQGWVEFPGVFDEPRIPVEQLKAQVAWTVTPRTGLPPMLAVDVKDAHFANDDAEGTVSARWETGPGQGVGAEGRYPGRMTLKGMLSRARGDRVWRYLPSSILVDARHYVRDAVREGHASQVQFALNGDLWHFPFPKDQGGHFHVHVPLQDVTLDYVPMARKASPQGSGAAATPYWPMFSKLNGQLIFEGQSMRIEDATAVLQGVGTGGYRLQSVRGEIDDLAADAPVLRIEGKGQGPLDDLLNYVNTSPVGAWTDQLLQQAQGRGEARLELALDIPLAQVEKATVKGQVSLQDKDQAALRLSPGMPWLSQARGTVQFTEDSIKVQTQTRVLGQDIRLSGERDAQGVPRFTATGLLTAEGLRHAGDWPVLARLARHLSGQTPLTVNVALARSRPTAGPAGSSPPAGKGSNLRPELQISTTLQGLGMALPAPFAKSPQEAWPLKITHRSEGAQGEGDHITVELAAPQALSVDYRRELTDGRMKVRQGTVLMGTSSGAGGYADRVIARAQLPTLDLDAWQAVLETLTDPSVSASGAPGSTSTEALTEQLPSSIQLRVGDLVWKQRHFKDMSVALSQPAPRQWRAQVEAPLMAGTVDVRQDGTGRKVQARLSRLSVPAAEADQLERQGARQLMGEETAAVPALDLVIDQFEWRGLPLGRLEVEALNRPLQASGLTEWRLARLKLASPDATLSASGNWAPVGAQGQTPTAPSAGRNAAPHRAAFSFTLDLQNTGALLGRLGQPQTLRGGKGKLSGQVSWLGSPLEPQAASLQGELKVSIDEGQFLKADPGMAKLLGVLSLQSLPRRLVLDFRDVFQQGFAFDRIEGDVRVQQGVAETRNLRMRGVQAVVLMEGQADLSQETQNLRVFVVPEINAGTASLAYAAINPAIGLGTFIAQVLLRKTVVEASTREFTVRGSWADPQVERVPRTSVPTAELPQGGNAKAQSGG